MFGQSRRVFAPTRSNDMFDTRKDLSIAALTAVLSTAVLAQAPPPAPPGPPSLGGSPYDLAQLPETKGVVRQYTLTPRSDVDDLTLQEGTEVKVPPHLSAQLVYVVRPGDAVTIHGLRAMATPLVDVASIRNDASGATVVDDGGPAGKFQQTAVNGTIAMLLHGRRGEVNGALLADGTALRLPPHEAERLSQLLAVGRPLSASGRLMQTPLGRVLEVQSLGQSADAITAIDSPPAKGAKCGKR
jgi:hypothetical protein